MSVRVKLGTHTLPVSTGRVHGPCPRTVSTNRVHGPWVVFIELYLCLHHVRHDAARRAGLSATADPCNTIPTDRHCESLQYCARHSCTVLTRGKKNSRHLMHHSISAMYRNVKEKREIPTGNEKMSATWRCSVCAHNAATSLAPMKWDSSRSIRL